MKQQKWRRKLRADIQQEAVAARKSIGHAKELALRKTRIVRDDQGIPREAGLSITEELECLGHALTHLQEAENRFSHFRTLLTRYRERLESEHEIELAHGPELASIEFGTITKPQRPKRGQVAPAVAIAWDRYVAENGEPGTTWGQQVACQVVGEQLALSSDTVRRYVRERAATKELEAV